MAEQRDGRETFGDASLEDWRVLGAGGFGYVYKATHKDWQFEVAIKLLDHGMELEADHMDSVAHQFVPKVYGMYQGIPPDPKLGCVERRGIVMELMEGGSLQSLQQALSGPPPWPLAFRLAHQVALAMNFMHSKKSPVVHSDLKPGNVLLDASLNAKIADFGLSAVSKSVLNITNKGDEGGTLAYTPPEAFESNYRLVRSFDVYSYGILLWTILTGKEPYPAGVNRNVLQFRIINRGERPNLEEVDESKAEGLEELLDLMKKCWDKDPSNRPTFRVCTEVTGRVYSKHKKGIRAAVNETLTKLDPENTQESVPPPGHETTKATDKPPPKPEPHHSTDPPPKPGPHHSTDPPPKPGSQTSPSTRPTGRGSTDHPRKYSHRLTLDSNTAHRVLSLSENNRKATRVKQPHSYPDHPERFDRMPQVLCTEGLTGRCYWEVERSGGVQIAVTYRGISRKGRGQECVLGNNKMSWSLYCYDGNHVNRYTVTHNSKETFLPDRPSDSNRVAVYLDCPAGTLSFYEVSSPTLTPLYTVQNKFTAPLYAGFGLMPDSSVSLCEDRQTDRQTGCEDRQTDRL